MKLIKPSFEIIEQKPRDIVIPADMEIGPRMWKDELINSVYRQIEIAGRTCYKSEDKITETSAKEFVDRMVKSGHGAMLEHGTVYLKVPNSVVDEGFQFGTNWSTLCLNPYTRYISDGDYYYYTTNYRVIIEHDLQGVLEYLCEPTEYHAKRITVKFICDRGVSHEFVRHRVFSFAQESTRYCNYSKDKFNNCVTYIVPNWCTNVNIEDYERNPKLMYNANGALTDNEINFLCGLYDTETRYLRLLENGWTPQQARAVLPNSLKTELVMTGTIEQWKGFFKLRDAGSVHPQAYELAHPLHEEFIKRGWIK
jgi:thymidylate synthase (FAD)